MSPHRFGDVALQLYDMGWKRIIPVEGKRPLVSGWERLCDEEPERQVIEGWHESFNASGASLVAGSNLILVDCDVKDDTRAAEIATIRHRILGDSPLTRIGDAPKSLAVYRVKGSWAALGRRKFSGTTTYDIADKTKHEAIEIFWRSGQVVFFGIHPDTKLPYYWPDRSPLDLRPDDQAIPAVSSEQVIAFLTEALPIIGGEYRETTRPQGATATSDRPDEASLPPLNERLRRARAYLQGIDGSVSGSDGHGQAFRAVCDLVRGFVLPENEALRLLEEVFNPNCSDANGASYPWSEAELRHKVTDAASNGRKPWGYLLRDVIKITHRLDEMNDHAVRALQRYRELFQRGGQLVHVVSSTVTVAGVSRPTDAFTIHTVAPATLAERLSAVTDFEAFDRRSNQTVKKPPPDQCVKGVLFRKRWDGIRVLDGIVDHPVLRPDGSVLYEHGYDNATRLYCTLTHPFDVPEQPGIDDARRSIADLIDVVCDVPFKTPAHRSAWLAAVLTPFARRAMGGPSPLFLFDGNAPGVGKSLMCDVIAMIVTGRQAVRMTNPKEDEEMRKRISSLVLAGDPLAFIDNVTGTLGTPALNAALTGTIWSDRKLGKTEKLPDLPLAITWYATANNASLDLDTIRRTVPIRIEVEADHPEERKGFKHPQLLAWVAGERWRLLASALTVLQAYCAAGQPDQHLSGFGSYDDWSNWVRSALVWAGEPDPIVGQAELRQNSAGDHCAALAAIIAAIEVIQERVGHVGVKAADLLMEARSEASGCPGLAEAIEEICPTVKPGELPSTRSFGHALKRNRKRFVDEKAIDAVSGRSSDNVQLWTVVQTGRAFEPS